MNRISDLTRRLWAALLALCLVLALTLPVFAEGESGTADTAEKETFHIGTVDDLLQMADSCRLDSWSKNRTVYLDADLELTGSGFAGIPSFSGVFEGQGHTISGLSLVDDGSVIGFFRYVQQGANVRDLVIRGRSMPTGSRSTVGGIAGSNAGTLHNCRFEGVSSGAASRAQIWPPASSKAARPRAVSTVRTSSAASPVKTTASLPTARTPPASTRRWSRTTSTFPR